MYKKILTAVILSLLVATSVSADRRKYVWTYQSMTTAKDHAELEFYQTTKIDVTNSWEYRIELENGLTDNLDFSVYQIFTQKENAPFKWEAFQLRMRYRFVERGKFFMDPVFYIEYRKKTDGELQDKIEFKLLFGKDFSKGNLSINPVYEYKWNHGEAVTELGLDVAISYSPTFKWSFGLESTTRYEMIKNADNETGSYFGPTVSFASGSYFYTFGYATGLTDKSNDARVRLLIGISL